MELFQASHQWATRPADERFWSLEDMHRACLGYRNTAATSTVRFGDLRVEAHGEDLRLVGKTGNPATLTNFAFGQLSARAKAPAGYLRKLPATLAAQNLNHGLKHRDPTDSAKLLFHRNGSMVLRAALSEQYSRIWNHELIEKLRDVLPAGWRVPPARPAGVDDPRARPATEEDCLNRGGGILSVKPGDLIAPAGLYASDRDCFLFLVNEDQVVDDGTEEGLARGIMLWNSEVGDKSLGGLAFNYKAVCGNHIVWSASSVREFRIRHTGNARFRAWRKLKIDVREYADSGASETEAKIRTARSVELGANKAEVLDAVLGFARKKRIPALNESRVSEAFDNAERHRDWYGTAPSTVWGMVNGLTEVSQKTEHAGNRVELDRSAARVMEMVF